MVQSPDQSTPEENLPGKPSFRTLKELIDFASGKSIQDISSGGDAGFAESLPFPFLALVGQTEMKMALVLALINPTIGGVLLIGPRGTGKTTAVRSILDLLPTGLRSTCFYGCLPEDIENGGIDAVCPDCAKKYGEGVPFATMDRVRLVELPLNSKLDDIIGSLDDRALDHERLRLKRGLLALADRNILYVDEVNLLSDEIVNAILDAAAQGTYTIHRGPISATYRARFTLIGSMNPEEGNLRSQILDRFGFRVIVRGLSDPSERMEAYRRVNAYVHNPRQTISQYSFETGLALSEIQAARQLLPTVQIPESVVKQGIALIQELNIDSLRAEITLFEAARAYAAADIRSQVCIQDLRIVSQMCLRMRRSKFMDEYFSRLDLEEDDLQASVNEVIPSDNNIPGSNLRK
jgi:magnesium chelatase subunit I